MSQPAIETLKSTIRLESLIGAVITLRNGKGLCPFHADRNPSFSVKGERFRCFACGEAGDVIDFTTKYYNLSKREAIKRLESMSGLTLRSSAVEPESAVDHVERRELVAAFRRWESERRNEIAKALRLHRRYRLTHTGPFMEQKLQELANLQGQADYHEYVYSILCRGGDREKYELFMEEMGYAG